MTDKTYRTQVAKPLIYLCACMAILSFTLASCNFERPDAEGVIYYDVSFPFLEGSILQNVFPEEMKLAFKDDMMYGEVRSLGGIVKTSFISDNKEKVIYQMLKNYSDHTYIKLDKEGVRDFLKDQPAVRYEETSDSVDVAGYRCAVTIAHFVIDSVPPIQLLHTNEIDIKTPNWYNPFYEMDEVLLGYEVEQFGMRMKLHARQVVKRDIDESKFVLPEKYVLTTEEALKAELQGMLNDFLD